MTDLPLKTNLLNQSLTLPNDFVIPNRLAISNNSIVFAKGSNPKPNESGLWVFIKSVLQSGWGTYMTQRTRMK
ncbi:hypothetical protein [uncultured Acinetobacter sp.]|uniref:hypothetical protein n=1 Tax=uncultured Acinetobacter sp. TaxID=165433 RepID=UPI00095DB268|nr:hypothetical protein [uncultured Acinetobacter sp.]OJU86668.1 MAG: hypothetical protein BGN93_00305 [Acinetobacter sp. 39-4]OJU98116.1 MAG: hypothetical protein BGO19_09760 [Acinetobacter sp. 38-8]